MNAPLRRTAPATLLLVLLGITGGVSAQASGSGTTTRYWDCCKTSCGWPEKAPVSAPVTSCDIDDNPLSDMEAVSGCEEEGGVAYMCSDQSPWAVDENLAYGFAAVNIGGQTEEQWCCACYELTFTSGPASGKQMVVQAVNTGSDLESNHFDIAIPGGGVGIFNGCTEQWGSPPNGWGERYGGITTNTCNEFPEPLQPGCEWRFDWFENSDNPGVDFTEVECPAELTEKTGCSRT